MNDEVIIVAEGINGTVMNLNEIQVMKIFVERRTIQNVFSYRMEKRYPINFIFIVDIIQLI
jgi:hypothetical protein